MAKKYLLFVVLVCTALVLALQLSVPQTIKAVTNTNVKKPSSKTLTSNRSAETQPAKNLALSQAIIRHNAMPETVVLQGATGIVFNAVQKSAMRIFVLIAIFTGCISISKLNFWRTGVHIFSRYLYCIYPFHSFW